jgi:hypothetical protein
MVNPIFKQVVEQNVVNAISHKIDHDIADLKTAGMIGGVMKSYWANAEHSIFPMRVK